jgi:hypothetical protein
MFAMVVVNIGFVDLIKDGTEQVMQKMHIIIE